jgi:hypothetical protein
MQESLGTNNRKKINENIQEEPPYKLIGCKTTNQHISCTPAGFKDDSHTMVGVITERRTGLIGTAKRWTTAIVK